MTMMNQEMLELAAKAAGYALIEFVPENDENHAGFVAHLPVPERAAEYPEYWVEDFWCPHVNDAQIKRLAVKLRISVEMWEQDAYAEWYDDKNVVHSAALADHGGDADKAWRYAVLSVAAQIGAMMP